MISETKEQVDNWTKEKAKYILEGLIKDFGEKLITSDIQEEFLSICQKAVFNYGHNGESPSRSYIQHTLLLLLAIKANKS